MTETDAATDRSSLVPGAHRLIRAIDGKEGPFSGTLITYGDGVAVCVDAAQLSEWPGWAYSDAEHVCGVLDIRRRADGHDALLPWCTQTVEVFLGQRLSADVPLVPGELGTLIASLLRGIRELGDEAVNAAGDWWLTGDGRPVFVHGGGGAARARAAGLVGRAVQHTADRATIRILESVATALKESRHHMDDDRKWERQLFAIAAPRALRLDVFAPERASDLGSRRAYRGLPAGEVVDVREIAAGGKRVVARADVRTRKPRRRIDVIGGLSGARELLFAVRERADAVRARGEQAPKESSERSPRRSHGRSLALAGALGVVVLVVGLMWPSGGAEDNAEAASRTAADPVEPIEPSPLGTEESVVPIDEPVDADDDIGALAAVPKLLDSIQKCVDADAETCADAIREGARIPTEGLVSQGADASSAVLVDDYGDVAVMRLTPLDVGGVEQMLVLERRNELWLLRDVYASRNSQSRCGCYLCAEVTGEVCRFQTSLDRSEEASSVCTVDDAVVV
ncbi:hypothetical protein DC31_14100 [Microbacterium sp. CH12i]|uniref:hypothetical protein n=1 Tax=Microbacterium sp. CH12i TaxID=1479651 RepID=UPI000461D9A1|nr:hypothetical protein [Microbacterium sp. CH12i]KDA05873.1 hypothetical protein DC31_14100 [Microbacterium sp. CH12i]